jgi:hypothetical protein
MNRLTRKFFAVLMLATLCIPALAQAEWVQKEIRWTISGVTGDGANIYVRDTTRVVFGGGSTTSDTTGWFSLAQATTQRGAQDPRIVNGSLNGAAQNDTTIIGYLVFQADSSAVPTASLTTTTLIIEGRAGGFGGPATTLARGWVKVDSIVVNGAAGNASMETIVAPLRTITAITGQNTINNIQAFAQLRARTLTATGVLSACRAFVRYWRPSTIGTSE